MSGEPTPPLKSSPNQDDSLDDLLAMSVHWDGYIREAAVCHLGTLGNPIAIPQLIVRVNDWVPQVRNAAKESLEKLLKSENAEAFVRSLPDVYHLQTCGRDNHQQLIANVTNFLLKPVNIVYIKSAIKNDNPYIARIAVKLCIEHSLIDKQALVYDIISHTDILIRNTAVKLLKYFTGQVLETFLQKVIHDPFMPIRREAFQIYLRLFPEKGLIIANGFLFDRHSAIREIAITQLLKNSINVEPIFINILLSSNQTALNIRCAILNLAYINSKQSIPIITAFVNNALPSIRKVTLRALAKLVGDEVKPYLLAGLKSELPSVAKESLALLNKLKIRLSVDELLDIFEHSSNYHYTFIVCISIAKQINKWDRLIFLLYLWYLSALEDGEQFRIVNIELLEWNNSFNCSGSQPSVSQIERIRVEYNQCNSLDNEKRWILEGLVFTLQTFKIIT